MNRTLNAAVAIALLSLFGCGASDLELKTSTKSAFSLDIIGYAVGHNPLALYALHADSTADLEWSAEWISDLPSWATAQGVGIGGLAGDPYSTKTLWLSIDRGPTNGARIYRYDIPDDLWTLTSSFDPDTSSSPGDNDRYWGLGANCDGKLTAVKRDYTTNESVDGQLISFPADDPEDYTVKFTAADVGTPDNVAHLSTGTTYVFGRDDAQDHYATSDGSTYYGLDDVAEAWMSGAMGNVVRWDDDPSCGYHFIVASTPSPGSPTPSDLYLVHGAFSEPEMKMTYYNGYSQTKPAILDLANLPGYCYQPYLCGHE